MAYQNNQPLGTQVRGGGGGWRALSFMNSMQTDPGTTTPAQKEALAAGHGPVTDEAAKTLLAQDRMLIMGGKSLNSPPVNANSMGYKSAYGGYTGGTGAGQQPKGSSY